MHRRSHAGGYCRRYMAVSASYPQRQATCSILLALLANPVRNTSGEVFETLATEDPYAVLRANIAAHFLLQGVGIFLLHTAYQGNTGFVASHLSRPHVCLEQLLLQKLSTPPS